LADLAPRLPDTLRVFERGWLSSNNVLFTGEAPALVDSGYLTHAPQTLALVRHALAGQPLARLLNTHLHSDHCGGNGALQAAYGCHTAIPAAEAVKVAAWDEEALSFRATGQQCARFGFDALLAPGDVLELGGMHWNVLGAPGHDPHAVLLFCPAHGILIAGDALWENGFGVIFPELEGESGFAETRATLDLIATLDARIVIPGHGRIFMDVPQAVQRAYSRLDYLAADPRRNAENAVKVLMKFLLLERQRIVVTEVAGLLAGIAVVGSALRQMALDGPDPYTTLANWAISSLIRARAARIDGDFLVDA